MSILQDKKGQTLCDTEFLEKVGLLAINAIKLIPSLKLRPDHVTETTFWKVIIS